MLTVLGEKNPVSLRSGARALPYLLVALALVSCGRRVEDLPLAVFDSGQVTVGEYVQRFLSSTRYKPNAKPTEENLRQIVEQEALARMAVMEAKALGFEADSTLRAKLRDRLDRVLFRIYAREEIIDAVITDSLIEAFYRNYSPQYRMRYILRAAPENFPAHLVRAQRDTIWMIYRRLKQGESFEELAKRFSQDAISAPKGGDLGWMIRESMGDPALRAVMDTLPQYSFSEPFRGKAGFYILYKGDMRSVPVPPLEEVRGRIWRTLYRTRRYLIDELGKKRFQELARQYHYRVDSSTVRKLLDRLSAGNSKVRELDAGRITLEMRRWVLARYDSGVVRVEELFADRKKRPEDEWEFWRRLEQVARRHLFALDARAKGYLQREDVRAERDYIWNALLRDALYERRVRRPTAEKLESMRGVLRRQLSGEDLRLALLRKRHELETRFRENLESELKRKYHFRFVGENFGKALALARKKKEKARSAKRKKAA